MLNAFGNKILFALRQNHQIRKNVYKYLFGRFDCLGTRSGSHMFGLCLDLRGICLHVVTDNVKAFALGAVVPKTLAFQHVHLTCGLAVGNVFVAIHTATSEACRVK